MTPFTAVSNIAIFFASPESEGIGGSPVVQMTL